MTFRNAVIGSIAFLLALSTVAAQQPAGAKKRVPHLTTDDVLRSKTDPTSVQKEGEEQSASITSTAGPATRATARVSSAWYWDADGYRQAEREQRQSDAPMAVYFYTDWCPYCKKLERDVLGSTEVERYLSSVIKVRINPEHGANEEEIARRYGITGYPSFFIVSNGDQKPRKITPYKRRGNGWAPMGPDDFVSACQAGLRREN